MQLIKGNTLKKILSNSLWMLFDKFFILALNLIVTVKIANYYGSNDYGIYEYAVSVVALFEMLVAFVDGRVIKKRYISGNPQELVWTATITRLLFSFICLIGGIAYLVICENSYEYNVVFFILLINAIVINLRFGMQNRYEYLLKSKKVIIASNVALTIGGILQLLAVHYHLPITYIALITAISSCISLTIVYIQYKIEFGQLFFKKVDKTLIRNILFESTPLAVAASCAIIYSRCGTIMIGNMLSKSDVGIYAISVKLLTIVQIGIAPIRESVYPKLIELYSKDKQLYVKKYIQITAITTWLYIIVVLSSFLILPFAFTFLNQEYADAFPIYQVAVLSSFFMYNAALRAGHYTLINKGSVLMYSQIASVIINVVLNYVLIKYIGIYGAALSTVITQCISLHLSNLCFGKVGIEVFKWQMLGMNPVRIIR